MSPDKNVEAVRAKLLERSQVGLAKYGVTTERTDTDLVGWLNHLQQELMDAAVYVQRSIVEIEKQEPIYQLQSADGRWIDQEKHSYDYNVANGHGECCRTVYAAPVVSPDVIRFLLGEGPLNGVHFGDIPEGETKLYWWRKHLRSAIEQAKGGAA